MYPLEQQPLIDRTKAAKLVNSVSGSHPKNGSVHMCTPSEEQLIDHSDLNSSEYCSGVSRSLSVAANSVGP